MEFLHSMLLSCIKALYTFMIPSFYCSCKRKLLTDYFVGDLNAHIFMYFIQSIIFP